MPVVGASPSEGHRLTLQREAANLAAPWRYTGTIDRAAGGAVHVTACLEADGAVVVTAEDPLEAEDRERVERMLRLALRAARHEDPHGAPPRRLTRWRGDEGR